MTYAYDSNGNLTSGDGRTLRYTSFDKPHTITKGTDQTVKFAYDGERARYKRSVTTGTGTNAVTTTTYYVGNVEIRNVTGGKQYTRYVEGHAIVKLTRNDTSRTAISTDYLITDHLGSIDAIADSSGALLYDLSFDAWGRRRAADSSFAIINTPATALTTLTPRGFTGHEMLDTVGLIHMNGRVYDPRLGRFTSADPIVQAPYYSQSFNRYAYVINNPLRYTDPSGNYYFVLDFAIGYAIGFGSSIVGDLFDIPILSTIGNVFSCGSGVAGCAGFAFGSTVGAGGSPSDAFQNAVIAGVSAYAFTAIGQSETFGYSPNAGFEQLTINALANGAVGGITNVLGGGKFGHGFAAAGLSTYAKPGIHRAIGTSAGGAPARVVARAIIGGTISDATGGKFANGAITAAFSQIYNDEPTLARMREQQRNLAITDAERQLVTNGKIREFWGSRLTAGDPVAKAALDSINPLGGVIDYLFGGTRINNRLQAYAREYTGGPLDIDQVRVVLAEAHIEAVHSDTLGVHGLLNPGQIAEYHHSAFEMYGLPPTTFGGTPFTGSVGEANITRFIWCRGCDWQ